MFTELSPAAQTAYAQLLEACQGAGFRQTIADIPGSFSHKQVKGSGYWYYQYYDLGGRLRQVYVGPDSDAVRALVEQRKEPASDDSLGRLARAAEALGCAPLSTQHYRVIARLAEYGFFRAGGILVGTHAFLAFGNMLGVSWHTLTRTQDIDFAHAGRNLAIALPADIEVHAGNALESLQMGLLPGLGASGKTGATWLNPRDPAFQIDFLTTLHREGSQPLAHEGLGVTLQPLKFMEYLLQDSQQAALFAASKATLANVPDPARYALHKLLVAVERPAAQATKADKDLQQAHALLCLLRERRPWDVERAWQDLRERGDGWVSRSRSALAIMARRSGPDIPDWLLAMKPA